MKTKRVVIEEEPYPCFLPEVNFTMINHIFNVLIGFLPRMKKANMKDLDR